MATISVTFLKPVFIAGTPYTAGQVAQLDESLISQFDRDTIRPATEPDETIDNNPFAQRTHLTDPAAHGRRFVIGRPFAPVKLATQYPLMSAALVIDGDSTSSETYPWVRSFCSALAAKCPGYTIRFAKPTGDSVRYDPPEIIATGSAGLRYLTAGAYFTYPAATYGSTLSGNFTVDIRFTPYSRWWDNMVLFAKASGTANVGFVITYNQGTLKLKWSNAGTAADYLYYAAATAVVTGYSDDSHNINASGASATPLWVRVKWTAATATAQFYESADGLTWSKLGSDVVGSGGVSKGIFASTADYSLGGMATYIAPDALANGMRFYDVRVYDDSQSGSPFAVFPYLEAWVPSAENSAGYFSGSPDLFILNASVGGTAIDWSTATTARRNQFYPVTDAALVILNKGYNHTTDKPLDYATKLAAWRDAVLARVHAASLALNVQAARYPNTGDQWYVRCEERRHRAEVSFAARNGMGVIDWHGALVDAGGLTAGTGADKFQIADGAHPGTAGQSFVAALWSTAWDRS